MKSLRLQVPANATCSGFDTVARALDRHGWSAGTDNAMNAGSARVVLSLAA
jgi:hypothetical protein